MQKACVFFLKCDIITNESAHISFFVRENCRVSIRRDIKKIINSVYHDLEKGE